MVANRRFGNRQKARRVPPQAHEGLHGGGSEWLRRYYL